MVRTIAKAIPFEIQPSKSPDFNRFRTLYDQISDPHCKDEITSLKYFNCSVPVVRQCSEPEGQLHFQVPQIERGHQRIPG